MCSKNEVICLLGADQFLREKSISAALELGAFVLLVSNNSLFKNRYVDKVLKANPLKKEDTLISIKNFLKTNNKKIIGIIPLNDWVLETSLYCAKSFHLKHLDEKTIKLCRNKYLMKKKFYNSKLLTPKGKIFKDYEQLKDLVKEFNFPIVLKPVNFGGSGGVIKVNSIDKFYSSYIHVSKTIEKYTKDFNIQKEGYLIEECIDTPYEVSVEIFCTKQKYQLMTVTEKYLSQPPYYSEMGHIVPSFRIKDKKLIKLAIDACKSLNITYGIAHVEIKIDKENYYIIEVGCRPGGDAIMDLIYSSYEYNPYSYHILSYISNILDDSLVIKNRKAQKTSSIIFLKAKEGVVQKINEEVSSTYKITSINLSRKIGEKILENKNWATRDGFVEIIWDKVLISQKEFPNVTNISKNLSNKIYIVS